MEYTISQDLEKLELTVEIELGDDEATEGDIEGRFFAGRSTV
jgi:hypothetical protein